MTFYTSDSVLILLLSSFKKENPNFNNKGISFHPQTLPIPSYPNLLHILSGSFTSLNSMSMYPRVMLNIFTLVYARYYGGTSSA